MDESDRSSFTPGPEWKPEAVHAGYSKDGDFRVVGPDDYKGDPKDKGREFEGSFSVPASEKGPLSDIDTHLEDELYPQMKLTHKNDQRLLAYLKIDSEDYDFPLTARHESLLTKVMAGDENDNGQNFLGKMRSRFEYWKGQILSATDKFEQAVGMTVGYLGEKISNDVPFNRAKTVAIISHECEVLDGQSDRAAVNRNDLLAKGSLKPTREMFGGNKLDIEIKGLEIYERLQSGDSSIWVDEKIANLPPQERPDPFYYDPKLEIFRAHRGINHMNQMVKEAEAVLSKNGRESNFVIPDEVLYRVSPDGSTIYEGVVEVKTITGPELEALIEGVAVSPLGDVKANYKGADIKLPIDNEIAYLKAQAKGEDGEGKNISAAPKFVLRLPSDLPEEQILRLAKAMAEKGYKDVVIQQYDFPRQTLRQFATITLLESRFFEDMEARSQLGETDRPGPKSQRVSWSEYGAEMRALYQKQLQGLRRNGSKPNSQSSQGQEVSTVPDRLPEGPVPGL